MRGACIDIGSNTTRLLVADCSEGRVAPVLQDRAFTSIAMGRGADGTIAAGTIEEVARVVADQLARARELGAHAIRAVATAAIRLAPNGGELADAVGERCGVRVEVLSGAEEARLAFLGAAAGLGAPRTGELGVADVGGGSCELAVGTPPDQVRWSASLALGSADVTLACLRSDPPASDELDAARERIRAVLEGLEVPHPALAVAVGGSAASLRRLAGPILGPASLAAALQELAARPANEVALRFGLERQRVRLLPAGLLILEAAAHRFGLPLLVGSGGLREGVVLEQWRAVEGSRKWEATSS